jgi:heme/copper-type cytochrome/quinol oxidase subunit 2
VPVTVSSSLLALAFMLAPGAWAGQNRSAALAIAFTAFGTVAILAAVALVSAAQSAWRTRAIANDRLSPLWVVTTAACLVVAAVVIWACSAHFYVVAAGGSARAVG